MAKILCHDIPRPLFDAMEIVAIQEGTISPAGNIARLERAELEYLEVQAKRLHQKDLKWQG